MPSVSHANSPGTRRRLVARRTRRAPVGRYRPYDVQAVRNGKRTSSGAPRAARRVHALFSTEPVPVTSTQSARTHSIVSTVNGPPSAGASSIRCTRSCHVSRNATVSASLAVPATRVRERLHRRAAAGIRIDASSLTVLDRRPSTKGANYRSFLGPCGRRFSSEAVVGWCDGTASGAPSSDVVRAARQFVADGNESELLPSVLVECISSLPGQNGCGPYDRPRSFPGDRLPIRSQGEISFNEHLFRRAP